MNVAELKLDREQARELYREYKKHQHYSAPIDQEIQRTYQLIAQGRTVIRALESIKNAGVFDDTGFPKLAIARSDHRRIICTMSMRGNAEMRPATNWQARTRRGGVFEFPDGTFPGQSWQRREAIVPLCPIHLRPKRGLPNYYTLWEAEWGPVVPKDPYLLRPIGPGDMWLVCAAWDLTEVERAALSTRLNG